MGVIKINSGYKEKSTVGLSQGEFLWDSEGNHYMIVELGCVLGLDGFDDAKVRRFKLNVTKMGKRYIKRQQQRVYLTPMPSASEMDLQQEESLWNS